MKTKKSKISKNIVCGIFAVILALSLTVCNNGSGEGSGDRSRLTVTGLPSGNWGQALVYPSGTDVSTWTNYSLNSLIIIAISVDFSPNGNVWDGFVPYSVYGQEGWGQVGGEWRGSGNFQVTISQGTSSGYYATVSFSNGNATVPFSSFIPITY